MVGQHTQSASVDHELAPGVWANAPQPVQALGLTTRGLGSAVLFPGLTDVVLVLGGQTSATAVTATAEILDNLAANPAWVAIASLKRPRATANAVLLPDSSVLVVGGKSNTGWSQSTEIPEQAPEYYKGGVWNLVCASEASARTYHSCAVLLPDGRVLSGGGDTRSWDYQVFTPHCLLNPDGTPATRPQWQTPPPIVLGYGQSHAFAVQPLPPGVAIDRLVLMAPGSTTHHSDMHQRLYECPVESEGGATLFFSSPPNKTYAPRGYYMAFVVTNTGIVSESRWVQFP